MPLLNRKRKALLVLEDGSFFEGSVFAGDGETMGEVVFNTGITGYQEVITDPSYKGQIVAMTYPLLFTPSDPTPPNPTSTAPSSAP